MVTGAVAAMPSEARWLAAGGATAPSPDRQGPYLRVRASGTGRRRAREAAEALLTEGASRLLSWGIAGGLDPRLASGALLLPREVAADPAIPCDADWHSRVRARLAPHWPPAEGAILSQDGPVTSPREKRRLAQAWGATALDQETLGVAEAARAAGVPLLVVRGVVDPADRALPPGVAASLGADGSVAGWHLLRTLAASPGQARALPGLARDLWRARATLRQAARLLGPQW
ncbi:phosphorylase family protein [Thiohalorhabdus sp.]|uniref:phosphorylase family protein n=1 Tax=Thiohalorhabdus sp. TaxID=3094134 RepID=UPI002FC2BC52